MTNPQDVQNVQQFGQATEGIFRRVYRGLLQRRQDEVRSLAVENDDQERQALRRQLVAREQEIKQLYGIIATMNQGVIIQNMEGRITMMNEAAQRMLGSVKNFWQSELGLLFHEHEALERVEGELEPLGRTREFDVNGLRLGVNVGAIADSDGVRFGTIMLLTDISRDTLAQRITENIMTSISHEFKTPMNVMRIASEILLGQPEDAPANRKMLEKLSRNIDILDRMVLELLDVSEMTTGAFSVRREPLMIEPIVSEVIASFEPEMRRAKLEWHLWIRDGHLLGVRGDVARLKWALGHLIRNAIGYTLKGGRIDVLVYPDLGGVSPNVTIRVKDTGVGIREEDMKHIFDPLYRGQPRTRDGRLVDPRGLGQGLYIAREVAKAHDGYLYAETTLYEWSTFTMTLPMSEHQLA